MKFSLDISQHATSLKALIALAKTRREPSYLSMMKFELVDHTLHITSTNLDQILSFVIPLDDLTHEGTACLIHHESILQVIALCSGVVHFDITNDIATFGKTKVFLRTQDVDLFPQVDMPPKTTKALVWEEDDTQELLSAFNMALPCVSKEEARIRLCGVHFVCENGNLHLEATNGHVCIVVKLKKKLEETTNFKCIIPSSAITHIQNMLTKGIYPTIFKHLGNLVLWDMLAGKLLMIRLIDEDFPDIQTIIPKQHTFEYEITEDMRKQLSLGKKVCGSEAYTTISLDSLNNFKLVGHSQTQQVFEYDTLQDTPIYKMNFKVDYLHHAFLHTDKCYHSLSEFNPLLAKTEDEKVLMVVMARRS